MKRIFLVLLITLAVGVTAPIARAGGGHGCGGGGWHGGGCYGGHGYCGWGFWPSFSFGIGFGGGYPSYGGYYGYPAYRYPAYGYASTPVVYAQPTYVYRAAQPYTPAGSVAVAATPAPRPAATAPVYVYSRPAPAPVVQRAYRPASVVAASAPASGTWVLDAHPYRYTPAVSGPSGAVATYVVTR